jgi:hypothetical protein
VGDTILWENINENDLYATPMANFVAAKDTVENLNLGEAHPEVEQFNYALLLLKTVFVQ